VGILDLASFAEGYDREVGGVEGIMVGPEGGERFRHVGGRDHRVLLEIPALEVFELCFTPDFEGVDPHTHEAHADCFYVLEGRAEFVVNGEPVEAGPGTFVAAPPGSVHGFRVVGGAELRLLNIQAPNTGFGDRLRRHESGGAAAD
jgi:mannose-6-phosphate isomerase-like protein (cupin superfamily)